MFDDSMDMKSSSSDPSLTMHAGGAAPLQNYSNQQLMVSSFGNNNRQLTQKNIEITGFESV